MSQQQEQTASNIPAPEILEKIRARKQDVRRKILIGSYCIHKANEDGTIFDLYQQMDKYIKRKADRELFQLTSLTK